ncbi:MAG: hypothetical protein AMJ69_09835 [Gammaproteobacteria bacterium SG8_47]|nr:MAG: hypothetical protein AMJ69_09835 [Gammaproteobacteria bacterium SG8_47]
MTFVLVAAAMSLSTSSHGQTAADLEAQCEAAREIKLAPLRQEKIDECKSQGNDAASCERQYADYGNATRQGGRYIERMFNDLPECVAAREAREGQREGTVPTTSRETTSDNSDRDTEPATSKRESTIPSSKRDTDPGVSRDSDDGKSDR